MSPARKTREVPLFPIQAVLFPGGILSLPIIEARDLDIVAQVAKNDQRLGIVLSEERRTVASLLGRSTPNIARVGTLTRIEDFDQNAQGHLTLLVRAEAKFKILDTFENNNRALIGEVFMLPPEPVISTGPEDESLVDVLEHLMAHPAVQFKASQVDYQTLSSLGGRLAELLPLRNTVRQRMLEINDPITRLSHLEKILDQLQIEADAP
ncbi:MAG: Lon protease-like protein [Candidatus Azotimanducaceae bacterium]|jgi:Lon protease-like protein|tara:strand:+ start:66 stop:692 length:627 start_codon:yes stop_codon:yes gene_type:complete